MLIEPALQQVKTGPVGFELSRGHFHEQKRAMRCDRLLSTLQHGELMALHVDLDERGDEIRMVEATPSRVAEATAS